MILRVDRSRAALDRRLDELTRRCRAAGLAVTPQRLAVYRALLSSEDHPTPEMLFRRVRRELPSLSLATIYKALDALERLGVVAQVSPVGDAKRYDANDQRHHHLVCVRCKQVMDLYDARFDRLTPPAQLHGFVPQGISVQVNGLCAACARRGRG